MALLAIRMSSVDSEPYTVLAATEIAISRERLSAWSSKKMCVNVCEEWTHTHPLAGLMGP